MGIVYLAMARGPGGFNKLVVVKELKPELTIEPAFLTMFLDEARLAARLSHPNIVQTNEVGSDGHRTFMAMDYLDGRSLDRARKRSSSSPWQLTLPMHLRIVCDVLTGLDYAHRLADFDGSPLHLVHRDISPSNVFLTFDGQVKLLDFGIAKTTDSSQETRAGVLKGKLSYMAPEQARGERVDARADVFAVGVLLWEALTGRRLRNANSEYELLQSLAVTEQPLPSSVNPEVPPLFDELCARALVFDRERRTPSAAVFLAELEHAMEQHGWSASSRELATVLSEMFREDRLATNQLIEAHVARARAGADQEVPVIPAAPPIGLSGFTPSQHYVAPPSLRTAASSPPPIPTSAPQAELASAAPSGAHLSPPRRAPRFVIPAVAIGVLATAAFVYAAFLLPGSQVAATTTNQRAAGSEQIEEGARTIEPGAEGIAGNAAASAPTNGGDDDAAEASGGARGTTAAAQATVVRTPDEELVEVEIRVTPEEATVTVDGAVVPGNPFRGKFVRGDAIRRIRATAPGFLAKSHALAFNANVKLDLSLERKLRPAPAKQARTAPRPAEPVRAAEPAPAPAAIEVNPAGGTKPRRPIDPANPYGAE